MVREKKEENNLSFLSNFIFMFKTHWRFDKIFLFLPIIKIPFSLSADLLSLVMPKIVLDAVSNSIILDEMLVRIIVCSILLISTKVIATKTDNIYKIHNNKFFVLYGFSTLFEKKMDMDYETFSSPKGKIAAKNAEMASQGNIYAGISSFFRSITELLTNLFGFLTYSTILISLNPVIIILLLLSYSVDGIIALTMEKFNYKDRNKWSEVYRKRSYISSRISLSAYAKDIRMYSLTNWLNSVYKSIVHKEMKLTSKRAKRQMLQMLFEGILIFIRDGLAYLYLINQYMNSDMQIGSFAVYFAVIAGFGDWLADIVSSIYDLQDVNHSVCDFREFMNMADNTCVEEKKINLSNEEGPFSIRFEHVSYIYPESSVKILDDINLEICASENIALVGVNGAGKTTFVKLLCGLIHPTSGNIYINNININTIKRESYFKLFSAVFQDISIMPVGIDENITFEKKPDMQKLKKSLKSAGIYNKISNLPQKTHTRMMSQFNEEGIDLSGGEMQKLLLARALYKDFSILILDEPTASLDPISENEFYLKYHELTKEKTSVYISHRLSSTRFCDRIVLIDGARIAEIGTHEELMAKNGVYAKMFFTSSQYYNENPGD